MARVTAEADPKMDRATAENKAHVPDLSRIRQLTALLFQEKEMAVIRAKAQAPKMDRVLAAEPLPAQFDQSKR